MPKNEHLNVTVHIQIQPESYAKQFYMVCFFYKNRDKQYSVRLIFVEKQT